MRLSRIENQVEGAKNTSIKSHLLVVTCKWEKEIPNVN